MIIYSDLAERVHTADFIENILHTLEMFIQSGFTRYDLAVELLIDFSDIETSITDEICSREELFNRETGILRHTGEMIARMMLHCWKDSGSLISNLLIRQIKYLLKRISAFSLPSFSNLKVPEGYSFYGYYPETYIDAAEKFLAACRPGKAFVIGLRSIGTSFSSVVAAVLKQHKIAVRSITVRPRGDYDTRSLTFSRRLKKELTSEPGTFFLLVDEGPGLSGSSFGICAENLSLLGVPDDRIVFISSWNPSPGGLISELGRKRWKLHKKFYADFEHTWVKSGKLFRLMPFNFVADISNGKWRSLFYRNQKKSPAAYPAEERKKYLCSDNPYSISKFTASLNDGRKKSRTKSEIYQLKFIGLGRHGKKFFHRAEVLSAAGMIPPALGFSSGFLISSFVPGIPLHSKAVDYKILRKAAEYLNLIFRRFPSAPSRNFEEMFMMISENITECLGEKWNLPVSKNKRRMEKSYLQTATKIDGRMFPFEWISSPANIYKTDSLTHHADQFFPGCQNICWDLAGYIIESELDREKEGFLLQQFASLSDEYNIFREIGFYKIAYLAFRLGHSSVTSDILRVTPDGSKVRKQTQKYALRLKTEIMQQYF